MAEAIGWEGGQIFGSVGSYSPTDCVVLLGRCEFLAVFLRLLPNSARIHACLPASREEQFTALTPLRGAAQIASCISLSYQKINSRRETEEVDIVFDWLAL